MCNVMWINNVPLHVRNVMFVESDWLQSLLESQTVLNIQIIMQTHIRYETSQKNVNVLKFLLLFFNFYIKSYNFPSLLPKVTFNYVCHVACVATLILDSQLRQELTKVRANSELGSHISYSQECKRVWRNEPSHSQMNFHFKS
jgi:hypothetical protein